jgi:hypothetical protein
MEQALFEKLTVTQLVKKLPTFYGTRRFITMLTTTRHCSISWTRSSQSTFSQPISLRSILILHSHLYLDLLSGSSLQVFLPKFCMHLSFHSWVKVLLVLNWTLPHEVLCGSGGIDPCVLNLGARRRWFVSFKPRPLYSRVGGGEEYWFSTAPIWHEAQIKLYLYFQKQPIIKKAGRFYLIQKQTLLRSINVIWTNIRYKTKYK